MRSLQRLDACPVSIQVTEVCMTEIARCGQAGALRVVERSYISQGENFTFYLSFNFLLFGNKGFVGE